MVSFVEKMTNEVRAHQTEKARRAKEAEIESINYRQKEWEKLLKWVEEGGWKKHFEEEYKDEMKRHNKARDFFLISSLRTYPSFIPYEESSEMMEKISAAFKKEGFHSATYSPPSPGTNDTPGDSPLVWVWVTDPKGRYDHD